MIMSCKTVGAEEAIAIGLADVMFERDFMKNVMEWIMPMATMPPHSLAGAKEAVYKGIHVPLQQALLHEERIFRALVSSLETKALGEKTIETKEPQR